MIHQNLDYYDGFTESNITWEYNMEELTLSSGNLAPKAWSKLTADEKIERLREQLKQQTEYRKMQETQMWQQLEVLREMIHKQNRKPDEEYF